MATITSPQQDRSFLKLLLEEIDVPEASFTVEWVASEFAPGEVFDEAELAYWAENNGYVLEE